MIIHKIVMNFKKPAIDFSVSDNFAVVSGNSETKGIEIVVFFRVSLIWAVLRIIFIVRIKQSIFVQLPFIYYIMFECGYILQNKLLFKF